MVAKFDFGCFVFILMAPWPLDLVNTSFFSVVLDNFQGPVMDGFSFFP